MSIQSNINQTLSLAGVLMGMNPEVQKMNKVNSVRRESRAYEKTAKGVVADAQAKMKKATTPEEAQAVNVELANRGEPLAEKALALKKQAFEVDPSFKRLEQIEKGEKDLANMQAIARDVRWNAEAPMRAKAKEEAELARAEAKAKAKAETEAKRVEKSRNFAKMITAGVPGLSFNPEEYEPPKPKKGDK